MLRILIATVLFLISASLAQAAVCTVDVGNLDFGLVDAIGGVAAPASADVTITCDSITPETTEITVCGNIGAGTGGAVEGTRQALSGGDALGFVFYTEGDYAARWGSTASPELGGSREIDVPVSGSSVSFTTSIYGIVPAGQSTAPVGEYGASFAASDAMFTYAEGPLNCASPDGGTDTAATFSVHASILANCLLATNDLDFGTAGFIGSNIDRETDFGLTCTPGTDYSIAIDGGGAADPDHRLLRSGANTVSYELYSDADRQTPWGTAPGATVSGTGNGAETRHGVYGRIPPQPAVAGAYGDTVVVTISY